MTRMMRDHVNSYRDLPRVTYQFQTKFRNELRAKSGILRGREFLMKDMYSFHRTEEDLDAYYEKAVQAYKNIFLCAGIGEATFFTVASGGMFSKFSHEFQAVCEAGEDTIYIDEAKGIALNEEVMQDDVLASLDVSRDSLKTAQAIEVGNIFKLGTRYSVPLGLTFKDEDGVDKPVIMGCYGLGLGRLMGTIVELLSDEKGLVWPAAVAPFGVHLVSMVSNDEVVVAYADSLYDELTASGVEVLYDDRDARAGEKLADADLIGIPTRIIVGKDTIASGTIEVVDRASGEMKKVTRDELLSHMSAVASA
jgi:prolyl-tRNA synthetase